MLKHQPCNTQIGSTWYPNQPLAPKSCLETKWWQTSQNPASVEGSNVPPRDFPKLVLMARHASRPQDANPSKPSDRLRRSPSEKHSRPTNCWQPFAPEPPTSGSLLDTRWHQTTVDDLHYPQFILIPCPRSLASNFLNGILEYVLYFTVYTIFKQ